MGVQFAGNILVQSNGGPLPISQGGTGQTTAPTAINALLPTQTGNNGKVLSTDGTNVSWSASAGGSPGGSDTYIQFNDTGTFGGLNKFVINKSTGALTSTSTFTGVGLQVSDAAATTRAVKLQTASSDRWLIQANNTAEAGANAGSNFEFVSVADNGLTQNQVYTVARATQIVDFKQTPTVNGVAVGTGTVTSISGSGGTTGLTLTGGPITTSGTLTLGGTLAIANGGTGQITANLAFNALVPTQSTNSGKFLTTDGTDTSWATVSTTPTVTSTQIGFGSGTNTLTSSSKFTWDDTNYVLTMGIPTSLITATITPITRTGTAAGSHLTVKAGQAANAGAGGILTLIGGIAASGSAGGAAILQGGGSSGGGVGGAVNINAGISAGAAGGAIIFNGAPNGVSTERFRILNTGAWSIGSAGTDYGTSGQLLSSNGNAVPTWLSQSSITVGTTTNIAGGVAGGVPYQSGVATTGITAAGTTGQYLKSNGASAPTWATGTVTLGATALSLGTTTTVVTGLSSMSFLGAGSLVAPQLGGNPGFYSASGNVWRLIPTGNGFEFRNNADNATILALTNVGAATFSGSVAATSFNATSTKRVKTAIKNLSKTYLSRFADLRPREYDRKDYTAHEFGFIAEEMALVYPEVVGIDAGGKPGGIDYGKLSTILTAKVQEQQKVIETLQKQMASVMEFVKGIK